MLGEPSPRTSGIAMAAADPTGATSDVRDGRPPLRIPGEEAARQTRPQAEIVH